jgi:two-component system, response regulator, stage 0 sporulation protein F
MIDGHCERSGDGLPRSDLPGSGKPPRVLLIEDDEVMREMLAEALRQEGYHVTECAKALPWLLFCVHNSANGSGDTADYDVVVSDIRMPNIGGLDVLRIIRDIRCAEFCPPTILITAFGDEQTHATAKTLGAAAVLDKPFQIHDLIEMIREVV